MEQPAASPPSLRDSLLLLLGVVATVLLALLLALTDTLQIRLPPRPTAAPVAIVTTVAPPTRPLPTATPSPTASPTPAVSPTSTPVEVVRRCGVAPEGWIAYTVRRGDTLFRLAIDSGATVGGLMVANCLRSTRLYPGMILFLPAVPLPPRPACTGPPGHWTPYRVQRGDNLFRLSLAHKTTVYKIMTANCLVSVHIKAGQLLYLPPTMPTPTPVPPTATPLPPPPPTDTPRPTATPTTTPTTTASPSATPIRPTATNTPSPTATNVPGATATNTPLPTATDTPPPTATHTPPPTATDTPLPTATNTPQPTATNTPMPTVTDPPISTADPTPPPASGDGTPVP